MRFGMFMLPLIFLPMLSVAQEAAVDAGRYGQEYASRFREVDKDWLVSRDEVTDWAKVKAANLPAMSGSPEWKNYLTFLEQKLNEFGAVDFMHNAWIYQRWDTSDAADDWSLRSDGQPVRVANYGAYSGSTSSAGITAELVLWDHDNPPKSVEGKIVVVTPRPHPKPPYPEDYLINYTFNDYEYATNPETFPAPFTYVDPSDSFTFDMWYQMGQRLYEEPAKRGAAGVIIVYDMAFERTEGMYTFLVPQLYNAPTLILSREDGSKVIADAKAGKRATLRLEARIEPAETYQLIAYLPGKDYGTPKDEQVLLVTHTDGPSISQDNGSLGILGVVKYFAHIPQAQRPRTLTIFLDCRHYMPGFEAAHSAPTWLNRFPEARKKLVALVQMEHLGELEYREVNGKVEPTGLNEHSFLWTRNNDALIAAAIEAIRKYGWSRGQVSVPERPGIRGQRQELWWGLGSIGLRNTPYGCEVWHCLDLPGFGMAGFLDYYYTIHSGIERWNATQHLAQTATMIELTGMLMTSDLKEIQPR